MGNYVYSFEDFFNPILSALHMLGGSASVSEIEESVIDFMQISDERVNEKYKGNLTKLAFDLAVARNYLKKSGLIENSKSGLWILTQLGLNTFQVDPKYLANQVRHLFVEEGNDTDSYVLTVENEFEINSNEEIKELEWQEKLLEVLKSIPPHRFERLCQRLLRELGFINVEVTGKVGDGGIDGKGILKINGILSFYIVFQCKRYQGSVSPEEVRAFRGALEGRADKGLFITTGTFTAQAKKEAIREGAKPIDLIDGFELAERLKEANLGVRIEIVEKIQIVEDWFYNF